MSESGGWARGTTNCDNLVGADDGEFCAAKESDGGPSSLAVGCGFNDARLVRLPVMLRMVPPGFWSPVLMLELKKANLECSQTCGWCWEKSRRIYGCRRFKFDLMSAPMDFMSQKKSRTSKGYYVLVRSR
jgi:hypothetical protein